MFVFLAKSDSPRLPGSLAIILMTGLLVQASAQAALPSDQQELIDAEYLRQADIRLVLQLMGPRDGLWDRIRGLFGSSYCTNGYRILSADGPTSAAIKPGHELRLRYFCRDERTSAHVGSTLPWARLQEAGLLVARIRSADLTRVDETTWRLKNRYLLFVPP